MSLTRLPSTVLGVLKSQCIRRDCLGRVRHGLGDNDLLGSTFGSTSRFKCWLLGYPRDLWDLWLHYFLVSKSKNSSQFSPQDLWLSNFGSTSSALGQKGDHPQCRVVKLPFKSVPQLRDVFLVITSMMGPCQLYPFEVPCGTRWTKHICLFKWLTAQLFSCDGVECLAFWPIAAISQEAGDYALRKWPGLSASWGLLWIINMFKIQSPRMLQANDV